MNGGWDPHSVTQGPIELVIEDGDSDGVSAITGLVRLSNQTKFQGSVRYSRELLPFMSPFHLFLFWFWKDAGELNRNKCFFKFVVFKAHKTISQRLQYFFMRKQMTN